MSEATKRLRQVLVNCTSIRGDRPTGFPCACATVGLRKDDLEALLAEVERFRAEKVPSLKRMEDDHALVEAAVRATIEACAEAARKRMEKSGFREYRASPVTTVPEAVRSIDPAPIVARVLGGGR